MNFFRTNLRHRHIPAFALVIAFSTTLSGCSGDEAKREYAIPRTLCGIAIDSDGLTPFLPAGKKITVKGKSGGGINRCRVIVDDKIAATTTQAWLEDGRTTAYFATGQALDALDHSADGDRFRYSGNEAFGKTRNCVDTKYEQELYTAVQVSGSKHHDADAMKRLIISYTSQVEQSAECSAGAL
ncbi:hypothetical protein [Streptomyces europaeiscabiei]|uniref:hypothetical protein n=1 Tax=Streptomyces europaeiscabiei TaxID=146819 RepID=UPI002E0FE4A0|nr:hypothetical protein OHB30_14565 [Streptomyces europaeiscabiei]